VLEKKHFLGHHAGIMIVQLLHSLTGKNACFMGLPTLDHSTLPQPKICSLRSKWMVIKLHPVSYASRALSPAEKNYGITSGDIGISLGSWLPSALPRQSECKSIILIILL